ncbi:MAG TPA: mucoidy inhibitor MuiA family protein, partial [Myxococcota bacterium]
MTTTTAAASHTLHPALDETRLRVEVPVAKVTLLEDRAQVRRAGTVQLLAGHNRLALYGAAPVLQDVSLRAEIPAANGRVRDVRVRRAFRIGHKEKPEAVAELERRIEELVKNHRDVAEDRGRAEERAGVVLDMMQKAMREMPEDAAWSLGHPQTWRETFEALSGKARALLGEARTHSEKLTELAEAVRHLALQRRVIDSPDAVLLCVVEIDVDASAAGAAPIMIEYTVPNALWRPFHTAELKSGKLRFVSQAAVWQNTGEEWRDVELMFSTARSSLGHEPPKLSDDKLAAKKKDARVIVEAREVAVQQAGLGRGAGAAAAPSAPAG